MEKPYSSQHETFSGYYPEYYENGEWKRIPIYKIQNSTGIPWPSFKGGILETIFLCGYEQAQALAWSFSADLASRGYHMGVRVKEYKVKYDIEVFEVEGPKDSGN